MNTGKISCLLFGLFIGSVTGSLAVIWFPHNDNSLKFEKSVNAVTGESKVTSIKYGDCELRGRKQSFFGYTFEDIQLSGSYKCGYLGSKKDVSEFKLALDKAVELGWVK